MMTDSLDLSSNPFWIMAERCLSTDNRFMAGHIDRQLPAFLKLYRETRLLPEEERAEKIIELLPSLLKDFPKKFFNRPPFDEALHSLSTLSKEKMNQYFTELEDHVESLRSKDDTLKAIIDGMRDSSKEPELILAVLRPGIMLRIRR